MIRFTAIMIFSFFVLNSALAEKVTTENSNVFFIYCGYGEGYFKKLDWTELGNDKPVYLKKGNDVFRVETYLSKDDAIEFFLRKGDERANGTDHQIDSSFTEKQKIMIVGGNFYLKLVFAKKGTSENEVKIATMNRCNEDAKLVQGSGNLDPIRNKKTTKLIELDRASSDINL